jgi:hypothetical protein
MYAGLIELVHHTDDPLLLARPTPADAKMWTRGTCGGGAENARACVRAWVRAHACVPKCEYLCVWVRVHVRVGGYVICWGGEEGG